MKCNRCSSVFLYFTFSCIWKKLKKGNIVPPTKHYLFQIDRLLVWSVLSIQYSNGLHIENTNFNVLSAIIRITYPFRSIIPSHIYNFLTIVPMGHKKIIHKEHFYLYMNQANTFFAILWHFKTQTWQAKVKQKVKRHCDITLLYWAKTMIYT